MFNLFTWGALFIDHAEEIVAIVSAILGGAGFLLGKAQKMKKEFTELIDHSKPDNKEFEELATKHNLKLAAKAINWISKKSG